MYKSCISFKKENMMIKTEASSAIPLPLLLSPHRGNLIPKFLYLFVH